MTNDEFRSSRRKDQLLFLYRQMATIRESEQQLAALFAAGEVPGFIHLSVGQEAVAAGVMAALNPRDTVASNHRGHGHALAKGVELDAFFLEVMGKAEGICKGRGGSMHVADMAVGMLGANGIVGAGIPLAVGSALAQQVNETGCIAVAFFGDGAMAEGVLHESLNLAAIWNLPMLCVCENNGWSEFSPTVTQFAARVCDLAGSFGIPARTVNGNDVVDVSQAALEIVDAIRGGGGPQLLECMTTRVRGHFEGDPQRYRDKDDAGSAVDPLRLCEEKMLKARVSKQQIERLVADCEQRVRQAIEKARAGSLPGFDAALADVYTTGARVVP